MTTQSTAAAALATTPVAYPAVGDPATIRYYTDTRAAVVVRVTPKSIVLARVETGPSAPDTRCDAGAYGVLPQRAEGILDQVIEGTEQRFTFRNGRWSNGSIKATLGSSVTWVDYRF
jgi:hypothetical protein